MRSNRLKVFGSVGVYHCMTRTVNGERLFADREKEILRKMIWQVADFCGVEVLTYCIMSNHFHVLVRVPEPGAILDGELMRRYKVLYPKPTKYQEASIKVLEQQLATGGDEAESVRQRLLVRMGDISEYMKTVKQRFSIWFNQSHQRFGTLWAERFKSVLVEGRGNPLQTMAAYIDLNPVRAGLVQDPKDYRFCGYAEAVAGETLARLGLWRVWADWAGRQRGKSQLPDIAGVLESHRMFLFGKGADGQLVREQVVRAIEEEQGKLPTATVLRCRVRYFTDGAILGSAEFVRGFTEAWQSNGKRKYPPKVNALRGAEWGDLAVIQSLRRRVFG